MVRLPRPSFQPHSHFSVQPAHLANLSNHNPSTVSLGIFAEEEVERLVNLPIEKLVVTNSVPQTSKIPASNGKLDILDISPLLAESIRRSHNGESFNILFGEDFGLQER